MKSAKAVNSIIKVSVIIPYWGDYKKYLQECIESVENQTFKNIEVIIVDYKTDLPSARNEGIKKAKGNYILPLDVDDKIEPTFIEKCLQANCDIVSTSQREFGDSQIVNLIHQNPTYEDFLTGNRICGCSLFKRKIWEDIRGYDENMKEGYEDWDFWLRALKKGYKVKTIQEPLYLYRKHGKSMVDEAIEKHEKLKSYILNKHI